MRTRLREDERLLRARRKCPSRYPQAYFPTRDGGKEPIPAEANEKKNFQFFYSFFEVFLLEPGICLFVYFSTGGSSVLKQKSLLGVGCKCQPTSCLLFWLSEKNRKFCLLRFVFCFFSKTECFVVPTALAFQRLIIV